MRLPLLGSTAMLQAGMSGMAAALPAVWLPSARVHVAPPSADLKTWPKPLPEEAELKFETVAQTVFVFDGSYSSHEMPPKPFPRGVKVCTQEVLGSLPAPVNGVVEVAVVPMEVRRIWPEAAPSMTRFELPGAIAIAVIEPPVCCALDVRVQLPAELSVRHMKRPAYQRRAELFGSILKTEVNGKVSPLMPVRAAAKLAPPFVDFWKLLPVFSA